MGSSAIIWWVAGMVLLVTEMTTGTFYMLILGISALIAGLLAWMGFIFEVQITVAIVLAALGCYAVSLYRKRASQRKNPTQSMDIGQKVGLVSQNGSDLRVLYRGAEWQAELDHDYGASLPAVLVIREVRANILIVGAPLQN